MRHPLVLPVVALLVCGCTPELPQGAAGVELTVRYAASMELDELQVRLVVDGALGELGTLPESGRELGEDESTAELLVGAELSGVSVGVRVDGLDGDTRVASAQGSVTPRVGEWTPLVVTLGAPAVVGDGIVHTTAEECDDRNTTAGDGCDGDGFVEDGYTCTGEPSSCVSNTPDAGPTDGGVEPDAGPADAGVGADAGFVDGGADAGAADSGVASDAGPADAGSDAGPADAGVDAGTGTPDAGVPPDAGVGLDAGPDADAGIDAGFDAGFDAGPPDVVINEATSAGNDEIELFNRSNFTVSLGGWTVSDSQFPNDQPGNFWVLGAAVMIEANGYRVLEKDVDYFNFGLGAQDGVKLFAPGNAATSTPVDSTSWPDGDAEESWCRSPNGTGSFGKCMNATLGGANP